VELESAAQATIELAVEPAVEQPIEPAAEPVAELARSTSVAETEPAQVAAAPRRRKRGRVVAPAGPPRHAEPEDSDATG
jgi:ribonuclease E